MSANCSTPLFHHAYDLLTVPLEWSMRPLRRRLVHGLRGEGVELATGSGNNLPYYAPSVVLNATEPDPVILKAARKKLTALERGPQQTVRVRFEAAPAEDLRHLRDRSQDFAVATLAYCTIEGIEASLAEVERVLKPGAQLHLLEHVRSTRPWIQRGFELLERPWRSAFGGCRLGQDTQTLFRAAGWVIEDERYYSSYLVRFTARPG